MDSSRPGARDVYAAGLEHLDVAVAKEGLGKHLQGHLRPFDRMEWADDDNVHEAVFHRGRRGDIGIVAVLRGIGEGDQEGFQSVGATLDLDRIGLGLVSQAHTNRIPYILQQTAAVALGKLEADEGIEAQAAGAEKGAIIDNAGVERVNDIAVDNGNGACRLCGYLEVACQSVSRATGYDSQRRRGVDDGTGHLVDRTVPAHGCHDVYPLGSGLGRQGRGVTGMLGEGDGMLKAIVVKIPLDGFRDGILATSSGYGIDDKEDSRFHSKGEGSENEGAKVALFLRNGHVKGA